MSANFGPRLFHESASMGMGASNLGMGGMGSAGIGSGNVGYVNGHNGSLAHSKLFMRLKRASRNEFLYMHLLLRFQHGAK